MRPAKVAQQRNTFQNCSVFISETVFFAAQRKAQLLRDHSGRPIWPANRRNSAT
jgi:hypothetical protein